ncbi:MAG TPA: hybrid sensor histidine kinase/response regulator, partial [Cyanobacteria bacterium UBA9273]|nr:hybrid sensor histidine kinase/response regulator [Cyanobacteria bacterium UBA9273]
PPTTNNQPPTTNHQIRFQIEDTGLGIKPEQLAKIFLPFEQVGDTSRRAEGTGLGLAITKKIVDIMGSKVLVESTPKVGSKFWFDLDVPVVSIPINSTAIKTTDTIIGYSGEKRKILIVEDRWENRAVLINMLEPIGFELAEAADGQEGVEKAVEFQPDLILTDLVMPVMDGYEMAQQLRQIPEFRDIIIIAISANAFIANRQNSLESGCTDFLAKPIQVENLLDKIQSYLNVSWIYDCEGKNKSQEVGDESICYSQVAITEMVIPPKEELLALVQAAEIGDVSGVEQGIIRLQQLNPEYTPFATIVWELAEEFEYEEIIKLINRYL